MTDNQTSIMSLSKLNELAEEQDKEAARIAEKLFEITTAEEDHKILTGSIAVTDQDSKEVKMYKEVLNRLFQFSKKNMDSGFVVLDRRKVEGGDKKIAALLQAMDGGLFVETFCDVVNEENSARMPNPSVTRAQAHRVFEILQSQIR